ncbi:MAG: hypothetical protein WAV18_05425 [Roseiarcus sp.]
MSKPTVSAAGGAMPAECHTTRRGALRFLARSTAQASALAALPVAALAAPHGDDAEILALSAEVIRRSGVADDLNERIEPIESQRWIQEGLREDLTVEELWARTTAWSYATGREDAIKTLQNFDEETDRIYYRMMAIPATTQPARAAKVRALLIHVMGNEWRSPDSELDWNIAQARNSLCRVRRHERGGDGPCLTQNTKARRQSS